MAHINHENTIWNAIFFLIQHCAACAHVELEKIVSSLCSDCSDPGTRQADVDPTKALLDLCVMERNGQQRGLVCARTLHFKTSNYFVGSCDSSGTDTHLMVLVLSIPLSHWLFLKIVKEGIVASQSLIRLINLEAAQVVKTWLKTFGAVLAHWHLLPDKTSRRN